MTQQSEQTGVCFTFFFFFFNKLGKDGHHYILGGRLSTAQSLCVIPQKLARIYVFMPAPEQKCQLPESNGAFLIFVNS